MINSASTTNQTCDGSENHLHGQLPILYTVIAVYSIGFGALVAIIGLFTGWEVFVPGIIHLTIGAGFAACAAGIAGSVRLAYQSGAVLSLIVSGVSALAVFHAFNAHETELVAVWGFLFLFFVLVLIVTVRALRLCLPVETDSNADNAV